MPAESQEKSRRRRPRLRVNGLQVSLQGVHRDAREVSASKAGSGVLGAAEKRSTGGGPGRSWPQSAREGRREGIWGHSMSSAAGGET